MKKTLALVTTFLLILSLCACTPQSSDVSSDTSTTTESVTTTTTVNSGENTTTVDSNENTTTVDGNVMTTTVKTPTTTNSNVMTTTTTGKQQTTTTTKVADQGVPANHTYTFDLPILSGDKTKEKLKNNPNRGFCLEFYTNPENGRYSHDMFSQSTGEYYGKDYTGAEKSVDRLRKFVADYEYEAPRVVQSYFYLTYYRDKDLDETAFKNIREYFDVCRELKLTASVRFAYVYVQGYDATQDVVSLQQMLRHMEQLKPLLAEYRDVLFALEGGFMGEWGEQSGGCSWVTNGHAGTIMDAAVAMVPDDLWVVTRYYNVWSQASAESRKRMGFHDDYIVGFSHEWSFAGKWDTAAYKKVQELSGSVLIKGEMPWGGHVPAGSSSNSADLNGWSVAKYLSKNHYTVLNCYHNNREYGGTYSMKKWRSEMATAKLLDKHNLNYYPEWFKTADGKSVFKSVFDYLQDFIGYHLVSSDVTVKKAGTKADVSFSLTNYGFAAPLALKEIKLVILDSKNNVVDSKKLCELVDLQAATTKDFKVSMTLPKSNEVYRVGLLIENYNGVGARLANDIDMVGQINLLGTMN